MEVLIVVERHKNVRRQAGKSRREISFWLWCNKQKNYRVSNRSKKALNELTDCSWWFEHGGGVEY